MSNTRLQHFASTNLTPLTSTLEIWWKHTREIAFRLAACKVNVTYIEYASLASTVQWAYSLQRCCETGTGQRNNTYCVPVRHSGSVGCESMTSNNCYIWRRTMQPGLNRARTLKVMENQITCSFSLDFSYTALRFQNLSQFSQSEDSNKLIHDNGEKKSGTRVQVWSEKCRGNSRNERRRKHSRKWLA